VFRRNYMGEGGREERREGGREVEEEPKTYLVGVQLLRRPELALHLLL